MLESVMSLNEEIPGEFIFKSSRARFTSETAEASARAVADVFNKLLLPIPFLSEVGRGTEGWLVFLNDFGSVLRIETNERFESWDEFDRINNDPDILQPLLTLQAGEYTAELCPGTDNPKQDDVAEVSHSLVARGIDFWDDDIVNVGRIPVRSKEWPEGRPVVIDRLSVRYMRLPNFSLRSWRAWLSQGARTVSDVQGEFYAPLRQAFAAAVQSSRENDMKAAWRLCQEYKQNGQLLSPWDKLPEKSFKCLPECGRRYAQRLRAAGFGG